MTTVFPIIGYLLMLVPMHFYNIKGDGHRKMIKEIMERREAEKAKKEQKNAESETVEQKA